jgi:FkbM family methyltransferase
MATPPSLLASTPASPVPLPALLRVLQRLEFPRKLGLCRRMFGRSLARHGICWVRTAPGPIWKLDLTNLTHQWLVYGHYEGPGFWRWLQCRQRHTPLRAIVDSGANIGQTVAGFSALAPSAHVLAYEPGAAARAWLTEAIAANGLTRVTVRAAGLGAASGPARLADDGVAGRHGSWNKVSAATGEPIDLVTLDEELAACGIDVVDVWKLDMEGYEGFALRGAAGAIGAGRIRAIHLEVAGEPGLENLAWLEARGYRAHGLTDSGRPVAWRPGHHFDNVLCLAPPHPAGAAR